MITHWGDCKTPLPSLADKGCPLQNSEEKLLSVVSSCGQALGAPFLPRGLGGADSSLSPFTTLTLGEAGVGVSMGLLGSGQRTDPATESTHSPPLSGNGSSVLSGGQAQGLGNLLMSCPTSNKWSGNLVSSTFKIHPESNQVPPFHLNMGFKALPLWSCCSYLNSIHSPHVAKGILLEPRGS